MLSGRNKGEFFVIFNGFYLYKSKQCEPICKRFVGKKKLNLRNTHVNLLNNSR